jgi:hypothetical protein
MNGRKRLTLDENGYLVASDGDVVGKLVNLTIDFSDRGGIKGGSEKDQLQGEEGVQGEERDSGSKARIWAAYVRVHQPRRKELDPQGSRVIADALKVATEAECIAAIEGCARSRFHMGDNDRGKKYNSLSQILRGKRGVRTAREQIDLMLSYADEPSRDVPSDVAAEISQAKRDVQYAAAYPGNALAKAKGEEGLRTLEKHGIKARIVTVGERRTAAFYEEGGAA